jgi:lipopolysaccharide export system protein LptA
MALRAGCIVLLFSFVLLVPFWTGLAQGKVIDVENADSLVGRVIDGMEVRELIGHVRFSQERVRVSCDRALQFVASGRVELTGNVVVNDDSVVLTAPRGTYHRDDRRAEAFEEVDLNDGHIRITARYGEYFVTPKIAVFRTDVRVRDTSSTLTGDSLAYFRNERRSVAVGNVTVENATDNITIRGGQFENSAVPPYSRMTIRPVLVQYDTTSLGRIETLVVRGRIMESFRDSLRRLVVTDSVEIVRAALSGTGGAAVFFTEGDSIYPVVWYGESQITGDSMNVYLEARRLHLVVVRGNAVAASRTDPRRPERLDQMTGETMQMVFEDQELQRIELEERAISIYHLYDDTTANGLNKTSGDRLVVRFRDRKVDAIAVSGGVEGQYVPENLLEGHEADYALEGFTWIGERPRPRPDDFRHPGGRK